MTARAVISFAFLGICVLPACRDLPLSDIACAHLSRRKANLVSPDCRNSLARTPTRHPRSDFVRLHWTPLEPRKYECRGSDREIGCTPARLGTHWNSVVRRPLRQLNALAIVYLAASSRFLLADSCKPERRNACVTAGRAFPPSPVRALVR